MSHPKQEPVDPETIRHLLLRLAGFIHAMDREGRLLEAAPRLLKLMGDLRSQLFEYEVRHTRRLLPKNVPAQTDGLTANERESKRVVDESLERQHEAEEEWRRGGSSAEGA